MVFIVLFWLSLFILVYHIILYGPFMYLVNRVAKKKTIVPKKITDEMLPTITVLCPAYNEAGDIREKIESFLALDYPVDKIKMVVISDDSTDGTNKIVSEYQNKNIELVVQKPRRGKQSGHNMVLPSLTTDLVLSTDANSIFQPDSVKALVNVLMSDKKIGLVSGELRLVKSGNRDSGEGLYWKFETFLKKMDSEFESIIGANGSLFLVRRELFTAVEPSSIDDFERVLIVLKRGFEAKYVPEAYVSEDVTYKVSDEIKRKIRIIAPEWRALQRSIELINPFKHFRLSWILISHKILRWLLFFFAFVMLISSALISSPFYQLLFIGQVLFYLIGYIGILWQKSGKNIPGTGMIVYFTGMCYATMVAFFLYLFTKPKSRMWEPIRTKEKI